MVSAEHDSCFLVAFLFEELQKVQTLGVVVHDSIEFSVVNGGIVESATVLVDHLEFIVAWFASGEDTGVWLVSVEHGHGAVWTETGMDLAVDLDGR